MEAQGQFERSMSETKRVLKELADAEKEETVFLENEKKKIDQTGNAEDKKRLSELVIEAHERAKKAQDEAAMWTAVTITTEAADRLTMAAEKLERTENKVLAQKSQEKINQEGRATRIQNLLMRNIDQNRLIYGAGLAFAAFACTKWFPTLGSFIVSSKALNLCTVGIVGLYTASIGRKHRLTAIDRDRELLPLVQQPLPLIEVPGQLTQAETDKDQEIFRQLSQPTRRQSLFFGGLALTVSSLAVYRLLKS